MEPHVGTKIIMAEPMTLSDFNSRYRGPENQVKPSLKHGEEGYCVEYDDGYTSWSPKEVFERCYRPITSDEHKTN